MNLSKQTWCLQVDYIRLKAMLTLVEVEDFTYKARKANPSDFNDISNAMGNIIKSKVIIGGKLTNLVPKVIEEYDIRHINEAFDKYKSIYYVGAYNKLNACYYIVNRRKEGLLFIGWDYDNQVDYIAYHASIEDVLVKAFTI